MRRLVLCLGLLSGCMTNGEGFMKANEWARFMGFEPVAATCIECETGNCRCSVQVRGTYVPIALRCSHSGCYQERP